jgi:Trehalose utilisation
MGLGLGASRGYPAVMLKRVCILAGLLGALCVSGRADVLIVADEFPAMEVVARKLGASEGVVSQLVDQQHIPARLAGFQAVVVYIHLGLTASAERAFIDYAEGGGRLVLLHHSISSGKRKNRDWFKFLGVELPEGNVDQGGYKWTEGVTVTWVNLAPGEPVMSRQARYPETARYRAGNGSTRELPAFTLRGTEVYLNHVLKGPRKFLMGLQYTDKRSGKTWMQDTAGWRRPAKQGWVFYFMPGHTARDFEDPVYGQIVLNAIVGKG